MKRDARPLKRALPPLLTCTKGPDNVLEKLAPGRAVGMFKMFFSGAVKLAQQLAAVLMGELNSLSICKQVVFLWLSTLQLSSGSVDASFPMPLSSLVLPSLTMPYCRPSSLQNCNATMDTRWTTYFLSLSPPLYFPK